MHKHAHEMVKYAQDALVNKSPWKLWEYKTGSTWYSCGDHPSWSYDNEYRRKTVFININGTKVPEPVQTPLANDEEYYVVCLTADELIQPSKWMGDEMDFKWLRNGIVHKSADAALTHAQAILSLTKTG